MFFKIFFFESDKLKFCKQISENICLSRLKKLTSETKSRSWDNLAQMNDDGADSDGSGTFLLKNC